MADMEPMDLDSIESDFDDKENAYQPNNALLRVSCIEKGYEDLDVSELNMKLRYSITPASSPMSKSFTANCTDNKNNTLIEDNNIVKNNHNLTQSLNSTLTFTDSISKSSPKSLPLQSISTDQYSDLNRNSSVRHSLDALLQNNITPDTKNGTDIDNLSLPSTSSSLAVTPEATTPTKEIPKQDGGSPIMRGLKSVLSMFRSSQSPIPPSEDNKEEEKIISVAENQTIETASKTQAVSSTPIKSKNISPLKESIVFNEDLERDLQWKDDSAVFFKEEKIPIHKLFPSEPSSGAKNINNLIKESTNTTVEYMDISLNETALVDMKSAQPNTPNDDTNYTESDSEFLDCETTFNKTEQHDTTKNITTELIQDTDANMSIVENEYPDDPIVSQDILKDQKINITSNATTPENGDAIPASTDNTNETVHIDISSGNKLATFSFDTEVEKLNETINVYAPSSIEVKINEIDNIITHLDTTFETTNNDTNLSMELKMSEIETPLATTLTTSNLGTNLNDLGSNTDIEKNAMVNFERASDNKCDNVAPNNEEEVIINETICIDNINESKSKTFDTTLPDVVKDSENENLPTKILSLEDATSLESKDNIIHVECKNDLQIIPESIAVNPTITLNEDIPAFDVNTNSGMLHLFNILDLDQNKENLKNECDIFRDNELGNIGDGEPKTTNIENLNITLTNDLENNLISQSDLIKQDINNMESTMLLDTISEQVKSHNKEDDKTQCIESSIISEHNIENICAISNENTNDMKLNSENKVALMSENSVNTDTLCANTSQDLSLNMSIDEDALLNGTLDEVIKEGTENQVILCNNNRLSTNSSDIKGSSISTVNEETDTEFDNVLQHTISKPSDIPLPFEDDHLDSKNNEMINKQSNLLLENKCEIAVTLNELTSDHLDAHDLVIPAVKSENNKDDFIITPEGKREDTTLIIDGQSECNEDKNQANTHSNKLDTTLNEERSTQKQKNVIEDIQNNFPNDNIKNDVPNTIALISATNESCQELNINDKESQSMVSELQQLTPETNKNELVNEIELDNIPKCQNLVEDVAEDLIKTKSKILLTPPSSPKIVSKGYNFNFDEIDDPFASKTKIRLSPTPVTPVNDTFKPISNKNISGNSKLYLQNKRKSQPAPQNKLVEPKQGLNSTFDGPSLVIKERVLDLVPSEHIKNDVQMLMKSMAQQPINKSQLTMVMNEDTIAGTCNEEELDNDKNKTDISKEDKAEVSGKNVFNLPEIHDTNFNPFATRSKMCESPPLPDTSVIVNDNELLDSDKNNTTIIVNHENNLRNTTVSISTIQSPNESNTSSLRHADETLKDINTEDEDTIEGPFLEAEDLAEFDKDNDIMPNSEQCDFIGFSDFPKQINDDAENGEMFIDAEAFEFLLNQNKSNIVADSGKESLFLKFDPLFAKRISSDGILAALNHVQNKQSTPKQMVKTEERNVHTENLNMMPSSSKTISSYDQNEDSNVNISKPTMIVNPAVSSVLSPKKAATPPKINRQSLTFTSPAMAVIDRLLSLSGNTSTTLCHDTSLPQVCAEQHQTDLALTQLREMLAEKEIHVQTLRNERKDLTDRLVSLESQVKSLEFESEDRLRKITDLNSQLSEKNKLNKTMATVVEEYERTIATLVAELEQDKRRNAEERMKLTRDRDEQTAHLASMEISFNDLHSKYEKSKQIIFSLKANEDSLKKSLQDFEDNQLKIQNNYELLKQHATSKLNYANQELEKINKAHEAEVLKLKAMIKRKDMHITSLEETLTQKTKANEELTAICDELINKVG